MAAPRKNPEYNCRLADSILASDNADMFIPFAFVVAGGKTHTFGGGKCEIIPVEVR